MNRLVLIGNGFDLAHGLKTKYTDFLLWMLKDEITKTLKSPESQGYSNYNKVGPFTIRFKQRYGVRELEEGLSVIKNLKQLNEFLKEQSRFMEIIYHQPILRETAKIHSNSSNDNWVDIEGTYYNELIKIIEKNDERTLKDDVKKKIIALNFELDFLKNGLINYLNQKVYSKAENINLRENRDLYIWEVFSGEFVKEEVERLELGDKKFPEKIHILNFNYTSTIDIYNNGRYIFENKEVKIESVNHIHGNLKKMKSNPIIFGYGDEVDSNYNILEDLNENKLLDNIKSFGYFKTNNYRNLLKFINLDDYQVYIVGHSCGLSDRVMLKNIFEHQNCKSIQIYYHEWENENKETINDYVTKTQEISRHFTNKGEMREKIVPENLSCSMSILNLRSLNND